MMHKYFNLKDYGLLILASAFLAFGLYQIHSVSGISEGGVLGMTLFLDHFFDLSPSISGFVLNAFCYLFGYRTLGKKFIIYSIVCTLGFSIAYAIFEQFPILWPNLYGYPLLAAIIGALFVGIGVGICVRVGGAMSGDDALAMSIAKLTSFQIQHIYLFSDIVVLLLSLSYIPITRIIYSLLTVIISGQIIGWIQKI